MCQGCGQRASRSNTCVYFRVGPVLSTGSRYAAGHYGDSVQMVTEYYLYQWAGTHSPHQKVEGLVLLILLITELLGIWLTNKLSTVQKGFQCSALKWLWYNKG